MSGQQYAVPEHYLALSAEQLSALKDELGKAETRASRATNFVDRTRAEQDAKMLRGQIASAEVQARVQARQERINAPAPKDESAELLAKAVKEGRIAPAVPYFAEPVTHAAEDDLPTLKKEAHDLRAVIDNPATAAADRLHAQTRLDAVKQLIQSLEQMHAKAGNTETPSFEQLAAMIDAGRTALLNKKGA